MRLCCSIELKRGVEIPPNFRQWVLSLIKGSIKIGSEDGELFYRKWYSSNRQKPFTFSIFVPLNFNKGVSLLNGDYFKLIFSTNNIEFLAKVYNGLLEINKHGFYFYGYPVKVKSCSILPERKFSGEVVDFKTISPFLLRDPKDGDFYIYPMLAGGDKDVEFQKFKYWKAVDMEEFTQRVRENLVRITGKEVKLLELRVRRIVPVLCSSKSSGFKVTYPGISAYLKIQARGDVLKHIYDLGIGARRSEGFGMLEVINE